QVLKAFAAMVRRNIDAHDLAGRLGGEEFAILLPSAREGVAIELAERIRRAFAEAASEIGGHPVNGTVSIGVAALRIGTHDLLGLIDRADSALYQAKEAGRDRVVAFGDVPEAPLVPAAAPLRLSAAAEA